MKEYTILLTSNSRCFVCAANDKEAQEKARRMLAIDILNGSIGIRIKAGVELVQCDNCKSLYRPNNLQIVDGKRICLLCAAGDLF